MRRGDASPSLLPIPVRLTEDVTSEAAGRAPLRGGFDRIAATFRDAIVGNNRVDPGFEAGLAVQRVIDAVQVSAKDGQWVAVDPAGRPSST